MLVGCMLWRIGDDILDLHDQIRWTADRGFQAVGFWTCAGQEGMWQGFDVATASARDIARLVSALAPFESVDLHAHRSLPVVGGDEQSRVLPPTEPLQTFDQGTHLLVQEGDLGRIALDPSFEPLPVLPLTVVEAG